MAVLCFLIERPDEVVTDDALLRCISELRKAFGDDVRSPDHIETIRCRDIRELRADYLRDVWWLRLREL